VKNVIQNLIAQKQFAAALRYLDSFNTVAAGDDETTEDARSLAAGLTAELAGPANIDLLLAEINDPESPQRADAGRLFTALGSDAVADLLEQLRHATDSDDRVADHAPHRLAQGAGAADDHRTTQPEGALVLSEKSRLSPGQIGNEETARSLAPLLEHDNDRLRQEALKSIYKTGE
jgi:HEAT repeat protein